MSKSGFIAIIGRPNSGKSTLLNSLLGSNVSIVTPKAQTTRERVLGILTERRGNEPSQVVFIDTPGIHRAKQGGLNEFMMNEAKEALEEPSLVWYLVDPGSALKHELAVIELLAESLGGGETPVFLLLNKSDERRGRATRERAGRLGSEIEAALGERGVRVALSRMISAKKGTGLRELLEESWKRIPEGPLYFPDEEQISDRPMRYFAAEKIREQLLLRLGEEIPYCCAVEIEKFEEPRPGTSKPITRIEAMIHVERDSQKGIVIGKAGRKIKEIGQAARRDIEEFIGGQVFLGLQVKVLKDWSKNAEALKRMGYQLPDRKKTA